MAKTPKKIQDPTQAALSAIEEALQIGEDTTPKQPQAPAAEETRRPAAGPMPAAASGVADEMPGARRRVTGRRMDRLAHAPANDDRQSVGQILQALHANPPRMPFYIAAIASAWWVVMALVIGYSRS